MIIMIICLGLFYVAPVFAADAVTAKIGNIESLVSGIITAAGAIVLLWGFLNLRLLTRAMIPASRHNPLRRS